MELITFKNEIVYINQYGDREVAITITAKAIKNRSEAAREAQKYANKHGLPYVKKVFGYSIVKKYWNVEAEELAIILNKALVTGKYNLTYDFDLLKR